MREGGECKAFICQGRRGGWGFVGEHTCTVPATKYEGKHELFIFHGVQASKIAHGPPQPRTWTGLGEDLGLVPVKASLTERWKNLGLKLIRFLL